MHSRHSSSVSKRDEHSQTSQTNGESKISMRDFAITTPEFWVPPLGDMNHGFPYLRGAGRLVLKAGF
jgi:hypothetical protein